MKKYLIILISFIYISVNAQWNNNVSINTSVCVQPYDQQNPKMAIDTKGGVIIVWEDYRADATQTASDIFVQRLDASGYAKWTQNGVAVCTHTANQNSVATTESGTGGVLMVWTDYRNGNADIYIQKVDSMGNPLWTTNGVQITSNIYAQKDARVIADGSGGAIIIWKDSSAGNWDIKAQKINSIGIIQWASGGVNICNAAYDQINARIDIDGTGGAIIVWQDKRNTVDYDIYAQRISGAGMVTWTANGIYICSTSGTQNNPKIEPDGSGGAYIVWQDKRSGVDYDIYAQRINSSGIAQWATNGIVVCNAAGDQTSIDFKYTGLNTIIIVWKDARNTSYFDIYGQKINANGTIGWVANGVLVSGAAYNQVSPNIITDGLGGAIVAYKDSSTTDWNINSSKITSTGNIAWSQIVCNAIGTQSQPKNMPDGAGGSIFVWQDKRNGTDRDIYAQKIFSNGTLTAIVDYQNNKSIELKLWPNPVENYLNIQIKNNITSTFNQIEIFDIIGNKVIEQVHYSNTFSIDVASLQRGSYFIKVYSDKNLISIQKIILK